jgi:hypothetical protein
MHRGAGSAIEQRASACVSIGMEREFIRFVEQPTADSYLAARDAMLQVEPETLVAADLVHLGRLLSGGKFEQLLEHAESLPATAALSPRIHYFAAEASAALGDAERAELEQLLFVACLQGILATGDGSPHSPYIICHASDENDVLEALEKRPEQRSMVQLESAVCEVVDCQDESQVWFDVTAVTGVPLRRRQEKVRRMARSRSRQAVTRTPR